MIEYRWEATWANVSSGTEWIVGGKMSGKPKLNMPIFKTTKGGAAAGGPPFLVFCIGMFSLGFPDVLPPTIHSVTEYTSAHVAPHLYSVTYSITPQSGVIVIDHDFTIFLRTPLSSSFFRSLESGIRYCK